MVAPNRFKICVTRALERPSRPSDCCSRCDLAGLQLAQPFEGAQQFMPRSGDFLAAAKSTTTHDAKFLLVEHQGPVRGNPAARKPRLRFVYIV